MGESRSGCTEVRVAVEPARRRIPRWAFDALPVPPGRLEHADDIDLRGMDLQGEHIAVVGGGLTTGTQPDVAGDRLTSTLQDTHPTRLVGGWPLLEHDDLCWPGTNVHVLGRLAMLSLGPAAGNLWGVRVGARRVASQIIAVRAMGNLSIDDKFG